MRTRDLLRAHDFLRTEAPEQLWDAPVDGQAMIALLGELLAAATRAGTPLEGLTLSAANIVVEPEPDGGDEQPATRCAPGEYVGLTVRGPGVWMTDWVWKEGGSPPVAPLLALAPRFYGSGVCYAYGRYLGSESSVTLFVPRAAAAG